MKHPQDDSARQGAVGVMLGAFCLLSVRCSGAITAGSAVEDGGGGVADGLRGAGQDGDVSSTTGDADKADVQPPPPWETLIDRDHLHQIVMTCPRSEVAKIETLHGEDAFCDFVFDGMPLESVTVVQKGSEYSGCRCLQLPPGATECANPNCRAPYYADKTKPGLKIKFDNEMAPGQRLFGLKKLVLNNAHQDVSFSSSSTIYEVYRQAGLAAPHTAFGRVVINGIPQGLYIVEEAPDGQFLQRSFGNKDGNLYEGSTGDFVSAPDGLDLKDEVDEMRTRDDVYALSALVLGARDDAFEAQVSKILDLPGFLTMWAIDAVAGFRDNYVFGPNNYFLYDNRGRFVFLPHSPDQGLGFHYPHNARADVSPYPAPRGILGEGVGFEVVNGLLAATVQDIPTLYPRYRQALERVCQPAIWNTDLLLGRIAQLARLLNTARQEQNLDKRMAADIAQFEMKRPMAEAFIKSYGTCRHQERMGLPAPAPEPNRVPVIITADLFYPPPTAGAHVIFDMAVLLSMPQLDVKGVVLGNALRGQERPQVEGPMARPGAIVLGQIETILRKRTPAYLGLARASTSLDDDGSKDQLRFQAGVQLILDTLAGASPSRPVTIVTLGTLRDVAAAFNRNRGLFKNVGKLFLIAGEASPDAGSVARDDNVALDPYAFAAIMKSGLPIYWVPHTDRAAGGAGTHGSMWTAPLVETLRPLLPAALEMPLETLPPTPVLQYFVNDLGDQVKWAMLSKLIVSNVESKEMETVFGKDNATHKDLFGGALLAAVADQVVTYDGARATLASATSANAVFGFAPADVTVSTRGVVTAYGAGPDSRRVQLFERKVDTGVYAAAMSSMTGQMLPR